MTEALAGTCSPPAADIASFLLDLHVRSNEVGYRELQRFALERFAGLVPFDGGVLAVGTLQGGVPEPHDHFLHGLPPEFMESWGRVRHEDRIVIGALREPRRTANHDVTRGEIYEGYDAVKEHSRRWGISHVLCTTQVHAQAGLYWVMAISRANVDEPFTEIERATNEIVAPHLVSAARRARIGQLRAHSHAGDTHGEAAAIANDEGLVLEADPGFAELVRRGWPRWNGPTLPREIVDLARAPSPERLVRGPASVRADRASGVVLLHVRLTVPADRLTPREREIATAFSTGETYRELGARFGIAPNTVRRHLSNVYDKLGISSKVELDKMMRDDRG